MTVITSSSNPRVRRWREIARDGRTRRDEKRALVEGEHLVAACLDAGRTIDALIVDEAGLGKFDRLAIRAASSPVVVSGAVFRSIVDVESPSGIAAEIAIPQGALDLKRSDACVFLDAIQDAGNVGTILRSAAAFGIGHAVLGTGCADAWSPKVLRAGMGAHFAMELLEDVLEDAIGRFAGKLCCTVPRGGTSLPEADLAGRIGWLFGSEGRGVNQAIAARAAINLSIPMPGGAESLNVAAAAAICFYEWSRRGTGKGGL